jgi:signal transduction histidine kinase
MLMQQLQKRRFESDDPLFLDRAALGRIVSDSYRQMLRLSKLVEDMLDVSRIAHGKLQLKATPTDLAELVRGVIDHFRDQLEANGVRADLTVEREVRGIWDPYRLEQVVTNLLTNAIKYGAGHSFEIRIGADERMARIVFRDHGIGISAEDQARLFRQFERAESVQGINGLGLGLYISRQIVEAHGGTIRVESIPGEGSAFTVEIPIDAGEALQAVS